MYTLGIESVSCSEPTALTLSESAPSTSSAVARSIWHVLNNSSEQAARTFANPRSATTNSQLFHHVAPPNVPEKSGGLLLGSWRRIKESLSG